MAMCVVQMILRTVPWARCRFDKKDAEEQQMSCVDSEVLELYQEVKNEEIVL